MNVLALLHRFDLLLPLFCQLQHTISIQTPIHNYDNWQVVDLWHEDPSVRKKLECTRPMAKLDWPVLRPGRILSCRLLLCVADDATPMWKNPDLGLLSSSSTKSPIRENKTLSIIAVRFALEGK